LANGPKRGEKVVAEAEKRSEKMLQDADDA